MQVTLTHNIPAFQAWLNGVQRQVPFAASRALNTTMFAVRDQIVNRTWGAAFTERNKGFARAVFRVKPATKQALTATLYDRLGRDYLALHAEGGTKTPRGRHVAVPSDNVKRSSGGRVVAGDRPRQAIASGRAFVTRTRGGGEAVFRRLGERAARKAGRALQYLYALATSARIPKSFRFYEDAETVAGARFQAAWESAFADALRTAR